MKTGAIISGLQEVEMSVTANIGHLFCERLLTANAGQLGAIRRRARVLIGRARALRAAIGQLKNSVLMPRLILPGRN